MPRTLKQFKARALARDEVRKEYDALEEEFDGGAAEAGFDAVSDIHHKGTKDTKVNYCSVSCLNYS